MFRLLIVLFRCDSLHICPALCWVGGYVVATGGVGVGCCLVLRFRFGVCYCCT